MRPSPRQLVRAVPVSSIPQGALHLPPKPTPIPRSNPATSAASPTLDRLLKSFAARSTAAEGQQQAPMQLPPNLRIVQFVPRRQEYHGVKASHRDLLRRLRREA
ncbi:hypothetical protein JCM8097_004540 [Rhodosporidiobolus ruineniae]